MIFATRGCRRCSTRHLDPDELRALKARSLGSRFRSQPAERLGRMVMSRVPRSYPRPTVPNQRRVGWVSKSFCLETNS